LGKLLFTSSKQDFEQEETEGVTQTSKSAVSQVSKPAGRTTIERARSFPALPIGKSATQQFWKPALRREKTTSHFTKAKPAQTFACAGYSFVDG